MTTVQLVPDWTEIDGLLTGFPEQPFARGEATLDDLVTAEVHFGPALAGEAIVRFKPTDMLIRRVAALTAHHGQSSFIHCGSSSRQTAKAE